jgi:hypothetical protein
MDKHIRPQIKNGQITKRTQVTYSVRATPQTTRSSQVRLAPLTPLWSDVSVGTWAQNGLSLLGLDEKLRSTEGTKKEKVATRPLALVGLLLCGSLLAGGFMFSLRTHFIASAYGRDKVKLKVKTDQSQIEHKHLQSQFEHAASVHEIDRATREYTNLAPLEFDQKKVAVRAKKIAITEKAKKPLLPPQRAKSAGD